MSFSLGVQFRIFIFLNFEFVMRFPMDFRWQNSGVQFRWGCMFAQILDCVCFGGNKTETLVAAFANISHFQKYISSILEKINSQSLEDTQVGYISQKYTLDNYTLEREHFAKNT